MKKTKQKEHVFQLEEQTVITYRWWRDDKKKIHPEVMPLLKKHAENRIREMTAQGYQSGELCETITGLSGLEVEYSGWWGTKGVDCSAPSQEQFLKDFCEYLKPYMEDDEDLNGGDAVDWLNQRYFEAKELLPAKMTDREWRGSQEREAMRDILREILSALEMKPAQHIGKQTRRYFIGKITNALGEHGARL